MHHKRKKRRNLRAGCKMCKPWKINGVNKWAKNQAKPSDFRRRQSDGSGDWWPGCDYM